MIKFVSFMPLYPPYVGGCASYSQILTSFTDKNNSIYKHVLITEYNKNILSRHLKPFVFRILPRRRSLKRQAFLYSLFSFILYRVVIFFSLILLRVFGYGHCHFHSSISTSFDNLAAKLLGYKITIDVRDLYVSTSNLKYSRNIICCSDQILKKIIEFNLNISVHKLNVPFDFDSLSEIASIHFEYKHLNYILYLGVVSFDKGVHNLISAFLNASSDFTFTRKLIIAGPILDQSIMDSLADNILYIGHADHELAINLIKNSDFVVLPGNFEGFPRVILESYFFQIPVLANKNIFYDDKLPIHKIDCSNIADFSIALKDNYPRPTLNSDFLYEYDAKQIIFKTIDIITS